MNKKENVVELQMNTMNVNAKPYVSERQKKEDEFFDSLEKQFVKNNSWLFEDWVEMEYKLEKHFNEQKFEQVTEQVVEKVTEQVKNISYADAVKGP